ncbi:MAG: Ribosome-recycling factor [candidate division TM6 bacterium GW2011_GWF2_37_49]|nr:MAG: Ribosome-recycling factor [candidate division TM6 bacterium GW2011_GWF2_37_49]
MEEIAFIEGDSKSIEKIAKDLMSIALKHFEKELLSIRTGRANTSMIENIKVECYGQLMNLRDVATLAAPDARLLTIQPWDTSVIGEIEKAIIASDLGASPVNDGKIVRIQLPQMSASRREEFVKLLGKKAEECRIAIRNSRKDIHNEIRDADKKHIVSEDFAEKLSNLLQKITDEFVKKTDDFHDKKAAELRAL